ncbi:MAG: SIMPL domain-containing protein [Jannaschia sp.]
MRIVLACLLLALAPAAQAQDSPRLLVEGRGEVVASPDMATITLAVVREAAEAGEAMEALSEASAAVLDRLSTLKIEPRDIQTGQLSLEPRWDYGENRETPRIIGYVARTTLDLRVRDLDGLGDLLDAAVSDGANGLEGLSFGLADPRAGEDDARRAAFEDAMAKAQLYADAAGQELGPIVSLSEGQPQVPGPMRMEMAADARSMPIAPGEVSQAVTVTLVVELVPAD